MKALENISRCLAIALGLMICGVAVLTQSHYFIRDMKPAILTGIFLLMSGVGIALVINLRLYIKDIKVGHLCISTLAKLPAVLVLCVSVILSGTPALAIDPPAHIFYVPLPDDQVQKSLKSLYPSTGSTIHSVVSVVATTDATIVYYDHWEDGYELDIANPTQSSSGIWGDGNVANGAPPGCGSNGCDVINEGSSINMENDVTLPRNSSQILFDGRDKFAASRAVAMSRSAWKPTPIVMSASETAKISLCLTAGPRLPISETGKKALSTAWSSMTLTATAFTTRARAVWAMCS